MSWRGARRSLFHLAILIAPCLAGAVGCRVDQDEFDRRIFACEVAAPDPACGKDRDGQPMACFAASQVGGADFCARTCAPPPAMSAAPPAAGGDEGVCLASGVMLKACHPSDDARPTAHPEGACDQRGLACYRTDLIEDEGVCTTLSPCDDDGTCRDPVRSVCAATFLASMYAQATTLHRDHLFCLQTGCKARGTSCSPGETCLQDVVPANAHPPDICVPNCDSHQRCPPNFLCYQKVSTAVAPNVCIPGLLGFTCDDSVDCMVGKCTDTGIGYKVCTTACQSDVDCQQFDGPQGKFVCIKNPGDPTAPGNCQSPEAYRGSICYVSADCKVRNTLEVCARLDPLEPTGTCLLPCPADGTCPARGGIPHTCIPAPVEDAVENICFPGYFGLPCPGDGSCVGDLVCRAIPDSDIRLCTRSCEADADCAGDRWIGTDGWCLTDAGVCFAKLDDGAPCPANTACKSGVCRADNTCGAAGETR